MTQFQGETARDALVNDYGLDIEEEADFQRFVAKHAGDCQDGDELRAMYEAWKKR